jgi:hypothetical protein
MDYRELTIENFKDGAIIKRLESALSEVLANIADPYADNGAREIILKIKFKPDDERAGVEISVNCTTKLKENTILEQASLDQDKTGRVIAYETMRQTEIPFATSATVQ